MRNAIRKVAVAVVGGSDWGILGYEFTDPETGETTCEGEGDPGVPVFQGIGIFARPVSDQAEAIMVHVGCEADHPILAAVRDEDGRRAYVAEFDEVAAGEVAIFNGQGTARVLIKADGSIEVTAGAGGTVDVKTKAGTAQATVKGETYRTAEDIMLTAVAAAFTAIAGDPAITTGATASTAAATAISTTFQGAAATYLNTVLKGE